MPQHDNEPFRGIRIAVWSGPRNISTALMRSFGNRSDTVVTDEPLYASYLARTGLDHPGRDEVLASQSHDAEDVFRTLTGPIPAGQAVWYQKQMAHHLPDDLNIVPLEAFRHAFLIRQPAEMLASLRRVIADPSVEQTALPQQVELWHRLRKHTGIAPAVVDSADLLRNPEGVLRALCERLGLEFQPAMLRWPAGVRPTDGVWARHWYGNVIESTGFSEYRPKPHDVPASAAAVLRECQRLYDQLAASRLRCPELDSAN